MKIVKAINDNKRQFSLGPAGRTKKEQKNLERLINLEEREQKR
jgi:hypothetical protein